MKNKITKRDKKIKDRVNNVELKNKRKKTKIKSKENKKFKEFYLVIQQLYSTNKKKLYP